MTHQIFRFHEPRRSHHCRRLSSLRPHPRSIHPSTTLLFSLRLLSPRCASVSPSFTPSRDNFRSKPESHCSSRCCCLFWSAICLLISRSIVHTLTSNPLISLHIRIHMQFRLGILCLSTFRPSGTPLRMGIGEIISWKNCRKLRIAEILGRVTIAFRNFIHSMGSPCSNLSVSISKRLFFTASLCTSHLLFCRLN